MAQLALKYTLIFKSIEYPLPAEGRKCEPKTEGKTTRKTSLGGTIHQALSRTNTVFPFAWEITHFDFCSSIQDLFNDYNLSDQPLYLRREKPSGDTETFEVVMDQPNVKLTEIMSTGEKWGSLEFEVVSKRWQSLSF